MDKRGLTIDPSRTAFDEPTWAEDLGSTRGPSPYATKAWTYWHKFETEERAVPDRVPVTFVLDNGDAITVYLYPDDVYDGGLYSNSNYAVGTLQFDEQGSSRVFSPEPVTSIVKQTYASIEVYDSKASEPGGVTPEEERYQENKPKGVQLGALYYEIVGPSLLITDWSHENWKDATPIRKAFESLLTEIPECVDVVSVVNRNDPFWKSLGFVSPFKGSSMLVHKNSLQKVKEY